MPYDDPILRELGGYFKAEEPGRRERAYAWATAIGLQKVDGLTPSQRYLLIGLADEDKQKIRELTEEKGGQKMTVARKSDQKTTLRSAIQRQRVNLKAAGRLRREGPDKGGHWEVIG